MDNSGGIEASLAGRYATALFELARDENKLEAVSKSLAALKQVLAESDDFQRLTASPVISRDEAAKAIAAVAKTMKIDPLTGKFLAVLAQNHRLTQLGNTINAFIRLDAFHRGETSAEVVSAHPLDARQIAAIKSNLKTRLGCDVAVNLAIDPAILGGLVVKAGSQIIDGSIRTQLNTLAQAMKG